MNPTVAPIAETIPAVDRIKQRLLLPRFQRETSALVELCPQNANPETVLRLVDGVRNELARLANMAQSETNVKSVSRAGDDGYVKVKFDAGEAVKVKADIATDLSAAIVHIRKAELLGLIPTGFKRDSALGKRIADRLAKLEE